MRVFAIGDLHMPSRLGKDMDQFGEGWRHHLGTIAADWDVRVAPTDLVLIPGDISWAMRLDQATDDLQWIEDRPGTKVMIRGNHDYWWQSITKVRAAMPPSCHVIQNDAWIDPTGTVAVGGSRMWDIPGLSLGDIFAPQPETAQTTERPHPDPADTERIFTRELQRLTTSLERLSPGASHRVAMVHYPPTDLALTSTPVTEVLERFQIDVCLFGHLHNLRQGVRFEGERGGVVYRLTSADYLDFRLIEIQFGDG